MTTSSTSDSAPAPSPWNMLGLQDPEQTQFILEQLIAIGLKILDADEGSLLLADEKNATLTFASVIGKSQNLVGQTVPIGKGVTGMAALTHDAQMATAADGHAFYRVSGDGCPHSVLAAPMLKDDTLIGVITAVSFATAGGFPDDACRTYAQFANVAAALVAQQQTLATIANPHDGQLPPQSARECRLVADIIKLVREKPKTLDFLERMTEELTKM